VVVQYDGLFRGLRYERDSYLNLELAPSVKAGMVGKLGQGRETEGGERTPFL
jgi:hypothetical protein